MHDMSDCVSKLLDDSNLVIVYHSGVFQYVAVEHKLDVYRCFIQQSTQQSRYICTLTKDYSYLIKPTWNSVAHCCYFADIYGQKYSIDERVFEKVCGIYQTKGSKSR